MGIFSLLRSVNGPFPVNRICTCTVVFVLKASLPEIVSNLKKREEEEEIK